jgi:hypothetical protein
VLANAVVVVAVVMSKLRAAEGLGGTNDDWTETGGPLPVVLPVVVPP